MRRREGEAIMIGDNVEIRILAIHGSRVKIGITAPRNIPVQAREVELVRTENQAAAETSSRVSAAMVAMLLNRGPQKNAETSAEMAVKKKGSQE
jgi:carbon storage regulator